MRISSYMIDIDLKCESGEHMLVHGNTGLVDVINGPEYKVLQEWMAKQTVGDYEEAQNPPLFAALKKRGYLIADDFNEEQEREQLIDKLQHITNQQMRNCKNVCFIPTYGCNFACPYCYEQSVCSHKRLTTEQVDNIFAIHNNDIPHISFFGGEPLLPTNKGIIEYIIEKAPNAQYSMITNGYYLKEYFETFRKINITNIQVTFDGMRDVHNRTRVLKNGEGTFDRIMEGVALYAENEFPITVRMNITPENEVSCAEFERYIYSFPWSENVKMEKQPVFQLDKQDKNRLQDKLLRDDVTAEHKNVMFSKDNSLATFLYQGIPLRPRIKVCGADSKSRYFDAEGNVYSCILAVGNEKKRIGTYDTSIHYEKSSMLTRSVASVPECRTCKYALLCGGGCPNAIPDNMDMNTTPNCGYFKNEIENMIPQVYKVKKIKNEKAAHSC